MLVEEEDEIDEYRDWRYFSVNLDPIILFKLGLAAWISKAFNQTSTLWRASGESR